MHPLQSVLSLMSTPYREGGRLPNRAVAIPSERLLPRGALWPSFALARMGSIAVRVSI